MMNHIKNCSVSEANSIIGIICIQYPFSNDNRINEKISNFAQLLFQQVRYVMQCYRFGSAPFSEAVVLDSRLNQIEKPDPYPHI